jgi:HTH-type transcriptional regulator/antitoxin HigA
VAEYVFDPDWVVTPGETLKEYLEENNLPRKLLCRQLNMTERQVSNLLTGRKQLTRPIAIRLELFTSIPATLWLNLERQYRKGLAEGKKVLGG